MNDHGCEEDQNRTDMSCFYVEKQVSISVDLVIDNVFKDSANL